MRDTVIKVEGIAKKYILGKIGSSSLRQTLSSILTVSKSSVKKDEFWALKDISFNVQEGEVLGIIGRNGAGKSTLLKILSQITEPTKGRIEIFGRVASLLEVGTGFHPELTGRENVFLNGSILGMRRQEIKNKFEEIVSFSGVEKFIDTPIKRYSSGMRVRLAFAVAAHLDPEILIIDEVLSVGDAEFRKKSLGKMNEIGKSGRTVLFVSHNMSAVRNLCSRSIFLENGKIVYDGYTDDVINRYIRNSSGENKSFISFKSNDKGKFPFQLMFVQILNNINESTNSFSNLENIHVQICYRLLEKSENIRIGLAILAQDETLLFIHYNHIQETLNAGKYLTTFIIPEKIFNEGIFKIRIHAGIPDVKILLPPEVFLSFSVKNISISSIYSKRISGYFSPQVEVETRIYS